jgi:3-deoxy-alpha-D-manno-octulosonate 8-oxidase
MKITKNISNYVFGSGSISMLPDFLACKKAIYCVDSFFQDSNLMKKLPISKESQILFIKTSEEPTTQYINELMVSISRPDSIQALVAIGSGATLDIAKALSNLLTNGGKAEDYQGWDLVTNPGVYKIGVPTLSGTGAETSRTCVMTNKTTGLKLGMNSDYSIYDALILDPDLTRTVPREQYFYTGMDAFMHCTEILRGNTRDFLADAYASKALQLCDEVFLSDDMQSDDNRAKMMVASYFGGCALANGMVGMIHPFSAGLSVVLGTRHCLANCLVLASLQDYYPIAHQKLMSYLEAQSVSLRPLLLKNSTQYTFRKLYDSTVVHSKPLINHLGDNYKSELTERKVAEIFSRI